MADKTSNAVRARGGGVRSQPPKSGEQAPRAPGSIDACSGCLLILLLCGAINVVIFLTRYLRR